ncbi:hypothetical protein C5167_024285 [Papaver somniferum]|uniref:GHMP kinase C-terminal domain-containing protein n=1 Tax=Papaver somniferum TaxID=3469 RepID=A0A4Y7JR46_PAPSO|nr:hypothetical protein C5167_024285 [Papaver somniferum]
MTTAVVAALLQYLGVVKLPLSSNTFLRVESEDLDLVHMVAQSAHCIAQGKVGSGVDVAPTQQVITDMLKGKWDHEKTQFSLPPLMTLLLGEPGNGGFSIPLMVGAVKKCMLAKEQWETYRYVLNNCSNLLSEKWKELASDACKQAVVKALLGARDSIVNIRCHMRKMGEEAGVPIEPESQTKLLDATMNTEGVLLGGVPGAGGFGAIFAVTLGESNKVTNMWSSRGVMSLLVREDPRGVSIETEDPRIKELTDCSVDGLLS